MSSTSSASISRTTAASSRTEVMSVSEAAFIPTMGRRFSPSKTSLFPLSRSFPSVYPSSCRSPRQRACTVIASNVAETKTVSTNTNTTSTSDTESKGEFHFDIAQFRTAVSGEWFGYQVTFSAKTGAAQNIEERLVPEEFRNWDVNITGFDCLTSSTVKDSNLLMTVTRALPTVGCEADAIVPDIDELEFLPTDTVTVTRNGGFVDGSFSEGPAVFTGAYDQRWNVAIADGSSSDSRRRARISFGRVDEGVGSVVVWLEKRDSDYTAGAVLPGCGGPDSSFAADPRTTPEDLSGKWHVTRTTLTKRAGWTPEHSTEQLKREANDLQSFFPLPRGLALSINLDSDNQTTIVEASWLCNAQRRTAVRRLYAESGAIEAVEHIVENRVN